MGAKRSRVKDAKAKKGASLKDLKPKRDEGVKGGAEPVGRKSTLKPSEPVND